MFVCDDCNVTHISVVRDGKIYDKCSIVINSIGRMHGAPYRGYGYVPLRFEGNVVRRMGTQHEINSSLPESKE